MTIRFKATTYLSQLVVSFAADRGLTLESSADTQVFSNIDNGDVREVDISVKLTDDKGYIAAAVQTTESSGRIRHKNTMIKIGDDGGEVKQLKSVDGSDGEKLILMPAEVD